MDDKTAPQKVEPIATCSIDHTSCLLHVSRWDTDQAKESEYTLKYIFGKIGLVKNQYPILS